MTAGEALPATAGSRGLQDPPGISRKVRAPPETLHTEQLQNFLKVLWRIVLISFLISLKCYEASGQQIRLRLQFPNGVDQSLTFSSLKK